MVAATGGIELATRLWAAGERVRRDLGADVVEAFREEHEQFVRSLEEKLGSERFAQTWAAGQGLTLEQALAEALGGTDAVVAGMRS